MYMPNVFSFTGHCKDYVTNGVIFVTNGRRKKNPEVILINYFGSSEKSSGNKNPLIEIKGLGTLLYKTDTNQKEVSPLV
jgi:hypothetical protein